MGTRPSVAIEFDEVIHSGTYYHYSGGDRVYAPARDIYGTPVPNIIEWLHDLLQTHDVHIVSYRLKTWRGRRAVKQWFKRFSGYAWHHHTDSMAADGDLEIYGLSEMGYKYLTPPTTYYVGNLGRTKTIKPGGTAPYLKAVDEIYS